jgi:hypothetical protein
MILNTGLSDREKAQELCRELDRMIAERTPFEAAWRAAQELVSSVQLQFTANEKDDTSGYDLPARITNKPSFYLDTLVNGLCGYGVNSNITWAKLDFADKTVGSEYGVKDWLQEVEDREYQEFDNSNFYAEIKMLVEQAATFGFGIMLIDENIVERIVRYLHINIPEIYLDVNENGVYDTVFRVFYMTVENAVARFGLNTMAETIKNHWDAAGNDQQRDTRIKILHAVFRRKNRRGASDRNTEMPYASIYLDVDNQHIIEESGYRSFPYAIFAWDRIGGKKYPISPAIKAINDIRLLHEMENTRLELAERAAYPPVAIPETMRKASEIFGEDGYIGPKAVLYYGTGEQVPAALNMGQNYPITLEITQREAEDIKQWFYVDFFLALMQQDNMKSVTATAVQALQGEKAAVMTSMIANLKEALQVAIQRTYDIMAQQGRIPDLPAALLQRQGQAGNRLRFTFASVLSQIQQATLRFQGATQFFPMAMQIAQLAGVYPPAAQALDRFDFDAILQQEARAANLSETAIREDRDVQAIQQQRAQAQAQAAQAQQEAQAAQSYKNLNEPVQPGSPAEAAIQGAAA